MFPSGFNYTWERHPDDSEPTEQLIQQHKLVLQWLMQLRRSDEFVSPHAAAYLTRLVCKLYLDMGVAVRISYIDKNAEKCVVELIGGSLVSNSDDMHINVEEGDLMNAIRPIISSFIHRKIDMKVDYEEGQAWVSLEMAPELAGV